MRRKINHHSLTANYLLSIPLSRMTRWNSTHCFSFHKLIWATCVLMQFFLSSIAIDMFLFSFENFLLVLVNPFDKTHPFSLQFRLFPLQNVFVTSTHRVTASTYFQGSQESTNLIITILKLSLEDKGNIFVSFRKKNSSVLRIFFDYTHTYKPTLVDYLKHWIFLWNLCVGICSCWHL